MSDTCEFSDDQSGERLIRTEIPSGILPQVGRTARQTLQAQAYSL
jgi:hypothetical protein